AALCDPVPPPRRLRRERRLARPGLGLRGDPRRPGLLPRRGPARAGAAAAPLSRRPLLRADHRLDRRRALGPLARGPGGRLGEGGGDPLVPRALDVLVAAAALAVLSPVLLVAAIAIEL